MSLDLARFDALTFDCYGTLIDWERGILEALDPILRRHQVPHPGDELLLEAFARSESRLQAGEYLPYRRILARVAVEVGAVFGVRPTAGEAEAFAASVSRWPPFPDSAEALRALGARYRLAVVSNVDDDLFEGSARQLGATFDPVVTAAQVEGYKPGPGHFHEVLRRLDLPKDRVLHVAQSLYHDIAPARSLGLACVWVNRRQGRPGGGATSPARAEPDLEVPDLATLARLAAEA